MALDFPKPSAVHPWGGPGPWTTQLVVVVVVALVVAMEARCLYCCLGPIGAP